MRNYIILNGKNSNEINGLLIQELPPISKPLIRTEVEEIDGRDGDIVTPLGYSAYDKEFTIGLYKDFDINEVAAYFNSEGTVTFSNEPDKYYYYQITAQIDFERLVRYRTATVTMHCQPFKYSATEQPITEDVSGTVSDEGTNLALENTAEAPFNTLDLKGNTGQQTYTGKNLTRYPYSAGGYGNGITFTDNGDGSITLNGQNNGSGNSSFYLIAGPGHTSETLTLPAGTYYFANPGANGVMFSAYDGTRYYDMKAENNYAMVLSAQTTLQNVYIQVARGTTTTYNNAKIWPMLSTQSGQTASDWEPYVGGIPAPNPDYPQAVQTVTGENVVKICGKNLLYLSGLNATDNGVANTLNNDGSITCAGTVGSGWNGWTIMPYVSNSIQAGTYTLSIDHAINVGMNITFRDSSNTNIVAGNIPAGSTSATITLPRTAAKYSLWVNGTTGTAISFTIKAQLELGSTATAYEPYQEQSYEVNLGKNLFDGENANAKTGYILNDSGTEVSDNTGGYTRNYSAVRPNTTYTISGMAGAGTRRIYFYNGGKTFLSRTSGYSGAQKITFTTPANCYFVNVQIYTNTDTSSAMASWQLELGSQATSYAAYFEPIELCKIGNYQDYIYKSDNKWYVRKEIGKVTLNSSNYNSRYGTNQYGLTQFLVNYGVGDYYDTTNYTTMMSDHFIKQMTRFVNTQTQGFLPALDSSVHQLRAYVRILTTTADTTDQFKAWLDANTPTFYYKLDPATDTEITNEALIAQLDDIYYHAHAYKGRTHITSSAATGNVPHIIAAEVGEDNESTITNAGNYLSKPKITVYGSGDISLYINDMHVLQITLGDEGYITIDTAQMEAYKDTLDNLKNRLVIGDYSNARLKPGANKIHFTGTVTKYVVENYSRWL